MRRPQRAALQINTKAAAEPQGEGALSRQFSHHIFAPQESPVPPHPRWLVRSWKCGPGALAPGSSLTSALLTSRNAISNAPPLCPCLYPWLFRCHLKRNSPLPRLSQSFLTVSKAQVCPDVFALFCCCLSGGLQGLWGTAVSQM